MRSLKTLIPIPDDDTANPGISVPDCIEIVNIGQEILAVRRPPTESGKIARVAEGVNKFFLLMGGGGLIVLALIAVVVGHAASHSFIVFIVWFGFAIQLCGVFSLLSTIVALTAQMWRAPRAELSPIVRLANEDVQIFLPFLRRLARFDVVNLRYVADHLAWHQEAFDRRRHAFAGPVEKIGVAPLAIAAITGGPKIFETIQSIHVGPFAQPSFAWSFLALLAGFYMIAWVTWPHSAKLQRAWWVINWAADHPPEASDLHADEIA